MGKRGPKGKGEAYHELTGTPNWATALPESNVPSGRPKKPKGVSKDALKIFRMLCKMLAARRALTPGDGEILGLYCVLYDRHMRALEALAAEGEVIKTTRTAKNRDTYTVQDRNPWLDVAKDCEGRRVAILDRLGLTPRAKDSVKPGAPAQPRPQPGVTKDPIFM